MLVIFSASGPTNATSRGKWARSSASRGADQFHQAHYNHYMAISNGYQKEALLRCSKLIRILGLPNAVSQFNLEPQAPATTWLNDECHWSQHLIVQFQISPFFSQNSDCFPNRYEKKTAFLIFFLLFFSIFGSKSPQSPPLVPGSCVVGWQRWRWSGAARNWRSRGVWTRRKLTELEKLDG